MRGWTDRVIAHRGRIVAVWLVLFVLGGLGAANLGGLLSNRFSVPGSDSERGLDLLRDHMGDRSDGAFTLVAGGGGPPSGTARPRWGRAASARPRSAQRWSRPPGGPHGRCTAARRGRRWTRGTA